MQIEKEEKRLSLFIHDMILYIQYPKEYIKTLVELIKGLSKIPNVIENHKEILLHFTRMAMIKERADFKDW